MKITKRVLLYTLTLVVIFASIVWNSYVDEWLTTQEDPEMVVRTDLLVIYPLVITLVSISVYNIVRDYRKKTN